MFSLIITIISIGLVAALALATLYYGGDAFNQGRAKAEAAKAKNQAQQLLAASVLYKTNHGRFPLAIADMVPEYLKTVPVAQVSTVSQALAETQEWSMVTPGEPVFALTTSSVEVCQSINESTYGSPGVLTEALTEYQVQCFGPTTSELTTLAALSTSALEAAATESPSTITLREEGVPTSPTDSAWLVSPSAEGESSGPVDVGGTGDGILSVDTSPIALGDPYNNANTSQLVLSNTGTGPLTITLAPSVTDANFSVWPVMGSTCDPIPAGETCWLTISYDPSAPGSHSGNLTFDTDGGAPVSIPVSGTAAVHTATGTWTADPASVAAVNTAFGSIPVNAYLEKRVYLRNTAMDGALTAGFTLVGDTQHFTFTMAPQKFYASNMYAGLAAGCSLNGASTATTGECTANPAFASFPNGMVHLGVIVRYRPLSAGTHTVQLIPATTGDSVLPGALTFTGSGY